MSAMALSNAREASRAWKRKFAEGIDPLVESRQKQVAADAERAEAERVRLADEETARNRKTLKNLLDTYEEEVLAHHRRGAATRRVLDGAEGLLKDFGARDLT